MINLELSLIKYIVVNSDLSIGESLLTGPRRKLYRILKEYYLEYNEFPNENTIKHKYPDEIELATTYVEAQISDTFNKDYLLEQLDGERITRRVQKGINLFNESEDKRAGLNKLLSEVMLDDIEDERIIKGFVYENVKDRYKQFKEREENPNHLNGKSFHIKCLNDKFQGKSGARFLCFVGLPGSGKTDIMVNLGYNLSRFEDEHVLYISGELKKDEIATRIDARDAMIDGMLIKAGTLSGDLKEKFKESLKDQKNRKDKFYIVEAQPDFTVEDVITWMLEYEKEFGCLPGTIIIDYLWLMETNKKYSGMAEKLGLIAKDLRHRLAKKFNVCVITATQESRGGALEKKKGKARGMEAVGESNKIAPHVHGMIMIDTFNMDNPELMNIMRLTTVKNTFGPLGVDDVFYARNCSYVGDKMVPTGMIIKSKKKEENPEIEKTVDLDNL